MIKKIVLLVVGVQLVLIAAWYFNIWRPQYSWQVASWLSLPVARIGGINVPAGDFWLDQKATLTSNDTKNNATDALRSKLIQESVIKRLAQYYHLTISVREIELLRQKSKTQYSEQLQKELGYSFEAFVQRVMIPWYREQLVRRAIIASEINPDQRALQAVREMVEKQPDTWDAQGKAIGETYGGDQPLKRLVEQQDLPGPYKILANLKENQLSDIVADNDGYHLFKLKRIISEDNKQLLELEEIYAPTTIDQEYLNKQTKPLVATYLWGVTL